MKRLTIYNIINLILVLSYVLVVAIQLNINFLKIELVNLWFPMLCVTIGLSLLFKAVIFKSDSSTWFGCYLLFNGATLLFSKYYNVSYNYLWPSLISAGVLSSLIVAVLFKDWLHYRIVVVLTFVNIPLYLYVFKMVNLGLFIVITLISVAIIITTLILKRFYLTKKEK